MVDIVSPEVRSRLMSGIQGKDTVPELVVRRYLHAAGLRFRTNVRSLPGTPDIVLPKYRSVVFVHGCFWHRHSSCRFATTPATRAEFWQTKFSANTARDRRDAARLRAAGWQVLTVWECQVGLTAALDRLFWRIVAAGASP
jgi:DNA mismatch endonuclease (patch repair protein)